MDLMDACWTYMDAGSSEERAHQEAAVHARRKIEAEGFIRAAMGAASTNLLLHNRTVFILEAGELRAVNAVFSSELGKLAEGDDEQNV